MHPDQSIVVPDGWPAARRSPSLVLTAVLFGLAAAAAAGGAAWAAASGDAAAAVVLLVGALFAAHLAGLSTSLSRRPRAAAGAGQPGVTERGEPGLAFPYAAEPYYWLVAVLVLTALGLIGIGVVAVAGSPSGWVFAAVCGLLAIFFVWFLVVVLRLAPGRIVLTPEGVFHRSLTFEHFVPWFAVYDVVAEAAEAPMLVVKAHPSDGTRVRRHTGRLGAYESQFLPFVVARAYWLGGNAVPAYQALAYYFRHPDRRADLAG
jgi:hypothetical protein